MSALWVKHSLIRWSAPCARCSSRTRASSTYSRSERNAESSSAECVTRSRAPSPSTADWARRSDRSLKASTMARIKATSATPAAASATMPCVVVRSCTAVRLTGASGGRNYGSELRRREYRLVGLFVVVELLLARHALHGDGDRHRPAGRGKARQRDRRGGG